jgi:hypothetical protein
MITADLVNLAFLLDDAKCFALERFQLDWKTRLLHRQTQHPTTARDTAVSSQGEHALALPGHFF